MSGSGGVFGVHAREGGSPPGRSARLRGIKAGRQGGVAGRDRVPMGPLAGGVRVLDARADGGGAGGGAVNDLDLADPTLCAWCGQPVWRALALET